MPDYGPPSGSKEVREYAEVVAQSFAGKPEDSLQWLAQLGDENMRLWREGGRVIAGLVCYRIGQFFGGKSVPMAGIAGVVVTPHARKSGAGSKVMQLMLEELHEQGMAISTLYPATQPMYRRLGYELAGVRMGYRLPVSGIDLRSHDAEIRPATEADEPVFQGLARERAMLSNGHLDRDEQFWKRTFGQREDAAFRYIIEKDGKPGGYLVYRTKRTNFPQHDFLVADFAALNVHAARRLLSFFADHRSVGDGVQLFGAPVEPLFFQLAEQEWSVDSRWDWMTRIVNLKAALDKRGYAPGVKCELQFDVRDDLLKGNAGKWILSIQGGEARVEKGGKGRIKLDIRGLAALYTSAITPSDAAQIGYLEAAEADLAALAAAFVGPAPWLPDFF